MEFDYSKLRGLMVEKFGSVRGFAQKMKISEQVVCAKLNNRRTLTKKDILLWAETLEIPLSDYGDYFFCPKSPTSYTN